MPRILIADDSQLNAELLDTHLDGRRLAHEIETACFRVAQEALTNVVRHARAARAWIELYLSPDAVHLVVRDDGKGFDPIAARRTAAEGASFGLLGMRERVELLGGEFGIDSWPGRGTCVRARFLLRRDGQEAPEVTES